MAAWLPYAIQAGEALILGLGTMVAAHQAGGDWQSALTAGVAAAVGKSLPSQLVGKKG